MPFDVSTFPPPDSPPSPSRPPAGDFQINLQPPSPDHPRTLWVSSHGLGYDSCSPKRDRGHDEAGETGPHGGGAQMTRMPSPIPIPIPHPSAGPSLLGGAWSPSTPPEKNAAYGNLGELLLAGSTTPDNDKYEHDGMLDTPLQRSRSVDSGRTIRPTVLRGVVALTSELARVTGWGEEGVGQGDQHATQEAPGVGYAVDLLTAGTMQAMEDKGVARGEEDEALVHIQVQPVEPDHVEHLYDSSSSSSGSDSDQKETCEEEVSRLRREVQVWKAEANKQRREANYAMYALNSHADLIVATIDFPSDARAIESLCGCYASPRSTAFGRRTCTLARVVGTPAPSDFSQLSECGSIQETFSRALRVLLFSFSPVELTLPDRGRTNLNVFTPPDILWLFVHTADNQLLEGLRFAAESMYELCFGSTRGVVLFMMLKLLERDEKGVRSAKGWQQWAHCQVDHFHTHGDWLLEKVSPGMTKGYVVRVDWKQVLEAIEFQKA